VDLKTKIARLSQDIEKQLSDTVISELFSKVERNQVVADGWNEHIPSQKFEFNKNALLHIFKQIRDLLQGLTQSKQQNPLEIIGSANDKNQAKELWEQVLVAVKTCNQSIGLSTEKIISFKSKLNNENIQSLQQEIDKLKLLKTRQRQIVSDLIQQWNDLKAAKQMHEQEKATARTDLDTLMSQTLEQYQSKINTLVSKFGVLFQIDSLRPDYVGSTGLPRSNYGLKVKGQTVKLSADDAPSFSNALSEGDKRTLAFAFFIARIESDPNLSSKIIVVDDPVCSLDRNRRTQTKRILRDIGIKSKQLIVLGHDAHFLRDLRDDLQDNNINISTRLLKINRVADNHSDFLPFNIDVECASDYYRNHASLQDFVDGQPVQDVRTVARAIRPLLEGYLHRRFPGHVQRSKLFGQIIGDARVAQLPNPLFHLKPLVTELHEINDYAGNFHHDTNGAADTAHIDESELRSYAERALTVIHRGIV
jgi:wobble nucleotide-excising tRNase